MERRTIHLRGLVQGIGFRPFVYQIATRHGVSGFVRNDAGDVVIEAEGDPVALDHFRAGLLSNAPNGVRIDGIDESNAPVRGDCGFQIATSQTGWTAGLGLMPDVATCSQCLSELRDPTDRRYRYAFLACARCGPRVSIVSAVPYDRSRTSMHAFPLCAACAADYANPENRRFHAEGVACQDCGPRLSLTIEDAASRLLQGDVLAVKGLGGYHLAGLARDPTVVRRIRAMKGRPDKPLAIMVKDVAAARALCHVSPREEALLSAPAAPIVLLRGLTRGTEPLVGVMLPYTPLHHLLLAATDEALVMTSANIADDPIATTREGTLALDTDAVLDHDRDIVVPADDSVVRVVRDSPLWIRRGRGLAPTPIRLSSALESPILALGGEQKATFAIGHGHMAYASHHLGDLGSFSAQENFRAALGHYLKIFGTNPAAIAMDRHPDYWTTAFAKTLSDTLGGIPTYAVQHHHAHIASCMLEHHLDEQVIGIALDGTGYGDDGTVWGGEVLLADRRRAVRVGHLRPVAMPGGERAIQEPWRMAAAYVADGELTMPLVLQQQELPLILHMVARQINSPMTSSCGRLFDAVAALLGLGLRASYDGHLAALVEGLAADEQDLVGRVPYPYAIAGGNIIDTRPLIAAIAHNLEAKIETPSVIARRFHTTIAHAFRDVCLAVRADSGIETVVLSGGCFVNAILAAGLAELLEESGFAVKMHKTIPPNDAGLALGQLVVAQARANATNGAAPCV